MGTWDIHVSLAMPRSRRSTVVFGSSLNREAKTQPAVPPIGFTWLENPTPQEYNELDIIGLTSHYYIIVCTIVDTFWATLRVFGIERPPHFETADKARNCRGERPRVVMVSRLIDREKALGTFSVDFPVHVRKVGFWLNFHLMSVHAKCRNCKLPVISTCARFHWEFLVRELGNGARGALSSSQ